MMKSPGKLRSTRPGHAPGRSDPAALAVRLRDTQPLTLRALNSIMRHPRSLARPVPTWRPPAKHLPAVDGGAELTATITRHRVGPRARARVRGFGETRSPAYIISVRVTAAVGNAVPGQAEAWIRALVPAEQVDAVHEISGSRPPTFCWLVDGHYRPVHSPASLFSGIERAA